MRCASGSLATVDATPFVPHHTGATVTVSDTDARTQRIRTTVHAYLDAVAAGVAADIAAGFQAAVVEVLADRTEHALRMMPEAGLLVVAGGVAANQAVRAALREVAARRGVALAAPPPRLCTDNAVMVAWAGLERLRLGLADSMDAAPRPRWRWRRPR